MRARQQRHIQEEGEDRDAEGERDPNTGSTHGDYEYAPVSSPRRHPNLAIMDSGRREDDVMDVDELEERDCVPSHTPSRSSSPSPSTHIPAHGRGSPLDGRIGSPENSVRSRSRSVAPPEMGYDDDLDLAGTCFDPSGGYLYVASTQGVVEWTVRGADKRWWLESGWL
jgi:hypothetical protein